MWGCSDRSKLYCRICVCVEFGTTECVISDFRQRHLYKRKRCCLLVTEDICICRPLLFKMFATTVLKTTWYLKTVDTIGNIVKTVLHSWCISTYVHNITKLWKLELNRSLKLWDNNERRKKHVWLNWIELKWRELFMDAQTVQSCHVRNRIGLCILKCMGSNVKTHADLRWFWCWCLALLTSLKVWCQLFRPLTT